MKKLIIANWKANKNILEASLWVEEIKKELSEMANVQAVVCGSFTNLPTLHNLLSETHLKVGAQNVSHLGSGAFTGEVSVEMLPGLVDYCLVGHSERKKYFAETIEQSAKKVELLISKNIIPVLCVADVQELKTYLSASEEIKNHAEKIIFVYEPPAAISGGKDYHPESPEKANQVCGEFKEILGEVVTLYGGSVNPDNIKSFLSQTNIDGALPGQASLKSESFISLLRIAGEAMV